MIMNINLEFRNANQVLPQKSDRYVCLTGHTLQVLPYSARHNRFNVNDWDEPEQAAEFAIKIRWWATLPSPLRNVI